MMNQKLAQYSIEGKFEKFIELEKDFFLLVKKDEKDPFHRFNGRFDSRSYGEGRFVLVKNDCDNFVHTKSHGSNYNYLGALPKLIFWPYKYEIKGNLHKNPELWKEIIC